MLAARQVLSALLLFVGIVAQASESVGRVTHHDLIASAGGRVEVYWSAPSGHRGKLPAVIYIHGVQGQDRPGARNFVEGGLLQISSAMGFVSVGMSMPGYGRSTGPADFCGARSQAALHAVLARLRSWTSVDQKRIIVSGLSCGATAAAMVADKENVAGMVLISGMYDFSDMEKKWHSPEWALDSATMRYIDRSAAADGTPEVASARRSALPHAGGFRSPVVLVAGKKDRTVDPQQSVRLDQALKQHDKQSTLILNPEEGHLVSYEDWASYVNDFARRRFGDR